MRKEKLFNIIGEVDEQKVAAASIAMTAKKKSHPIWFKWGVMAACLCLVVAGAVLPIMNNGPTNTPPVGEIMIISAKNLDIHYVSENGTIESKNIKVVCTAVDIFKEWAKLNGIDNVTLVDCVFDNGAVVNVKGDKDNPETAVEHVGTSHYTLTLTLSAEFKTYAEGDNGNLLIESLKETFYNNGPFDEFNLIIDD